MKFTAFLCLVTCLHASATGLAQNVTLSEKGASLKKIFRELNRQTGYEFLYKDNLLNDAGPVNISVKNAPIEEVLEFCFNDQPLSFEIIEKTIIVKPSESAPLTGDLNHRLYLPVPPITVRGRIINEKGESVVASVSIKGTTRGTTSDANGEFELKNVDDKAVLIITATNIETITVNAKSELNISVKTEATSLNEVVVNKGYYSESKRLSTGNVARVDAKTIEKQPISNPLQAIQGRMAGVYVQQTSGISGGGFNIQIRGQNSLRKFATDNGNLPLYIVDGVPFTSTSLSTSSDAYTSFQTSPLNTINPADIQSIEILKDADATAIYGSRGANGVVLITTKKPNAGQTRVEINVYKGEGKVSKKLDLLNTKQYINMRMEAIRNDDYQQYLIPDYASYFPDIMLWDTVSRYTDWQTILLGNNAEITSAQIGINGGDNNTQFQLGGGYYKETTVFSNDFSDTKLSNHFSLNHASDNKRFRVTLSSSLLFDKNILPQIDPTKNAITLPPNAPSLYDENGNLNWENDTWVNPLQGSRRKYKGASNNLVLNSVLSYQILPGLLVKSGVGYTRLELDQLSTFPINSISPNAAERLGSISVTEQEKSTWSIEPQIEYQKALGKGRFTALAGSTLQRSILQGKTFNASGIPNDDLIEDIGAAINISGGATNYAKYKYAAVFARLNYNWNNKYLVNLTGRRDGSSRFGENKQYANFGAIGVSWIFSKEMFVKNFFSQLSFGKIRMSYGITGSDQIGDYQYLSSYSSSEFPYGYDNGLIPQRLVNPDYSWETNKKWETGLELGFFKDRLFLAISYYANRSSNQLVGYKLPPTAGFTSVQYNLPATVQNTGLEIETRAAIINNRDFAWEVSANMTIPKNKLVLYPDILTSSYANVYEVGKSLYATKMFPYINVDTETGLYNFADVDGNGIGGEYPADFKSTKEITQQFYGGLGNRVTYKGFELDFLFQFVKQTGYNYIRSFSMPGTIGNQTTEVLNHWSKAGDITDIQKFSQELSTPAGQAWFNYFGGGDNLVVDASFIRLKNISVSWQLPSHWIRKIYAQQVSVYLQGQNVATISNYIGLDPEQPNDSQFPKVPPLKVISAGLKLKF